MKCWKITYMYPQKLNPFENFPHYGTTKLKLNVVQFMALQLSNTIIQKIAQWLCTCIQWFRAFSSTELGCHHTLVSNVANVISKLWRSCFFSLPSTPALLTLITHPPSVGSITSAIVVDIQYIMFVYRFVSLQFLEVCGGQ